MYIEVLAREAEYGAPSYLLHRVLKLWLRRESLVSLVSREFGLFRRVLDATRSANTVHRRQQRSQRVTSSFDSSLFSLGSTHLVKGESRHLTQESLDYFSGKTCGLRPRWHEHSEERRPPPPRQKEGHKVYHTTAEARDETGFFLRWISQRIYIRLP